ncbi:phosphatase [Halomicrobium urmianum]|uniref:phosphatase n=1 Tax=Halomicrobium urmianum TaxID=1586233 RepID=UPI001CDA349C|nr:phosphatase [Halomicrobium urmianum]
MVGPDWRRHGSAIVRPFGHCHDGPITRRIGDRDLFVGNVHAADPERCDRSFESVLSLTCGSLPATTHHRPLVDGSENDWADFEAAADAACRLVGDGGSLLIHCSHGISRSPAVAAAAIAVSEDRSLADALSIASAARPPAVPHPKLHEQATCYVAARR